MRSFVTAKTLTPTSAFYSLKLLLLRPSGSGRLISGCPQEKGVVKTKWGSISPGHLIAGVASALQETYDTLETIYNSMHETEPTALISSSSFSSTRLSNLWISTVSGDLGEIVMYQASAQPIIGNEGYWNDTIYPRLYMSAGGAQEMTDAELLGGIDGECWISLELSPLFNKRLPFTHNGSRKRCRCIHSALNPSLKK